MQRDDQRLNYIYSLDPIAGGHRTSGNERAAARS